MIKTARCRIRSRAMLRGLIIVIVPCLLFNGCAFARIDKAHQSQLVEETVPGLLQPWIPKADDTQAGETVAANVGRLKSNGWFVEEFRSSTINELVDKKYSREYITEVPPRRLKEEESAWDFYTSGMVENWESWNSMFWEVFFSAEYFSNSRQELDKIAQGHFFRAISPGGDRIYDVVIFRPKNPEYVLIADPANGAPVAHLWKYLNPPRPDDFPHMSVYGPVRYVKPTAAKRFNVGKYTVLEVYARRYSAGGTFLGAEFGSSPLRDTYILVLISNKELVVVQTKLFSDATPEILMEDLGKIIAR